MGYIAKLVYGNRTLDLNDGTNYALMPGFKPPSVNESLNVASGTSANRTAGGKVVGSRANDRSWTFSVRCLGSSDTETHRSVSQLGVFLNLAKNKTHKLYFVYKPNDDFSYEPLWGQHGAYLRYEIKHGTINDLDASYSMGKINTRAIIGLVTLLISPYALGKQQVLASGRGGIREDISDTTGLPYGLIVARATTNKITNPSFETNTTGWTAGGSNTLEQSTEQAKFGSYSLKTTYADNSAYAAYSLTLTAANHAISCWVYIPSDYDGANVRLFAANFTGATGDTYVLADMSLTDQWQYMHFTITPDAGDLSGNLYLSFPTGDDPSVGKYVYWDGIQVETKAYPSPYCDGDMLGCAWSGTRHASTTTREAGRIRIDSTKCWSRGQGTIVLAVRHSGPVSDAVNRYLFDDTNFTAYFATGTLYFTDGTNTASDTDSSAANELVIYHFTWGSDGLAIYRNGASFATDSTYTAPAAQTYIYVGCKGDRTYEFDGVFVDGPSFFDEQMTSAEVLADYNNTVEWLTGGDAYGRRVTPLPWFWNGDGDFVLDNCDDDSRYNYAIIGGIPGTARADTIYDITYSATSLSAIWLGLSQHDPDIIPKITTTGTIDGHYYSADYNETSSTSADAGSAYTAVAVGSDTNAYLIPLSYKNLCRGDLYAFIRASSSASDIHGATEFYLGDSSYPISVDSVLLATDSTRRLFFLGEIDTDTVLNELESSETDRQLVFGINLYAESPPSTLNLDFILLVTGTLVKIYNANNLPNNGGLKIRGDKVYFSLSGNIAGVPSMQGKDTLDLYPNSYNLLRLIIGNDGEAHAVSNTGTFTIDVIPRYDLL